MDEYQSLSHTKWECKYHVVFIPKCRRKTLYVQLRQHLGEVFRRLRDDFGILLRDVSHSPGLAGCLRVSIGERGDMDAVIGALATICAGRPAGASA